MFIAKMPDGKPEIYRAVQGEGQNIGLPVIFVRLSSCCLHCNFCDTAYTWNWKNTPFKHVKDKKFDKESYQMTMPIVDVEHNIRAALEMPFGYRHRNIIFSGGEPLLQQQELCKVMDLLKEDKKKWHFEVETSGSVPFTEEFMKRLNYINCSPKLASSGNEKTLRDKPKVIAQIMEAHNSFKVDVCFKFVVHADNFGNMFKDLDEVLEWQKSNNVPSELIYMMPQGTTVDEIQKGTALLNDMADHHGFKISTRLQVLVYGDKRAV